jgi:hypothetical protein
LSKQCKVFNFEIKQVGAEEDRVLRFVGSDETPDRDNDILETAGWKVDNYLKNPVFMAVHNYEKLPVGKSIKVFPDIVNKNTMFDIKFPTIAELSSDPENPSEHAKFADTVYMMYKNGYLNAVSVGFHGVKYKTRDDESVLELPEWRRGRRYLEQELLELSAVPVPCNPNALQQARAKGLIDDETEKFFKEMMVEELKEVDLLMDTNTKEVFVTENGKKTAKVKIDPEYLERLMEPLDQKSGATLSAKSKKELNEIHDIITKCNDRFRKFIDAAGMMPDEPMMTAARTAPATEATIKVELPEEFKQVLEEIKAQVLLLSQKDAPKDIDLDAIELPKPTKDADLDELDIEPGELKTMIAEIIKEQLKGGRTQ